MRLFFIALLLLATPTTTIAAAPPRMPVPAERTAVTHHNVSVGGRTLPYSATAGTLLLKNDRGDATASVFYVAYTEDGVSPERRPITFLYNGGPGSSSIWLHMGSVGPKRVQTPGASAAPAAPFTLADNPYTLLDKSDLVFVDAVGTGFSRVVGRGQGKDFWGVDEDARAYGQFIQTYLSRHARWNSPKFLFGESYGTTRSANLVNYLQNRGTSFNGVVLLSTVLNFTMLGAQTGGAEYSYIAFLPTEAAAAWYHHRLPNRPPNLAPFLQTVREFAAGEYASALMQGDRLDQARYNDVVAKLHAYTGLPDSYIRESDLRIPPWRFEKELFRAQGQTVGRLDARFLGYDLDVPADSPEYDPSDVAISGAYVGAFNNYVRTELHFTTDQEYHPTNYPVVNRAWNWNRGPRSNPSATDVSADLKEAMTKNPHLLVFAANGYYDVATPFFGTEYTLSHLGLPPELRKHIRYGYYESGHMVYLNVDALAKMKADLASFYDAATSPDR